MTYGVKVRVGERVFTSTSAGETLGALDHESSGVDWLDWGRIAGLPVTPLPTTDVGCPSFSVDVASALEVTVV